MNLAALKLAGDNLKTGGGSDGFFSTKVLTEDGVPIRLLPEPAILNGIFYFPVVKYWMMVNGKRASVICASTFTDANGKQRKSIIQSEIDEARDSDDQDVQEVLANTDTKTNINQQTEWWMAALQLDYKTNRAGEIEKMIVVDGKAKVFQCGKATLLEQMVKIATGGKAARTFKGAPDGIADRVVGSNLLCAKSGTGKQTRYTAALDEQCEMDEKYYINIPNVYEIAKAQMPLASWQQAAIRNHIYGEEIPVEIQAKEDARKEKAKAVYKELEAAAKTAPAPAKRKVTSVVPDEDEDEAPVAKPKKRAVVAEEEEDEAPVPKKKAKAPVVEEEEDEAPAPKKKIAPSPTPKKKSAPVEDDDDPEEDLDDDDAPPAKPVAKKKVAVLIEEDDEEELVPVVKKKAAAAAAPTKKAVAPKAKTVLQMLEDDEDE